MEPTKAGTQVGKCTIQQRLSPLRAEYTAREQHPGLATETSLQPP